MLSMIDRPALPMPLSCHYLRVRATTPQCALVSPETVCRLSRLGGVWVTCETQSP